MRGLICWYLEQNKMMHRAPPSASLPRGNVMRTSMPARAFAVVAASTSRSATSKPEPRQ